MTACNKERLKDYAEQNVAEWEQMEIEHHLLDCTHCLEEYLAMLNDTAPPGLSSSFTTQTIERVEKQYPALQRKGRRKNRSLLHYMMAAGLTLVLMMSGVFDRIMDSIEPASSHNRSSVSEQMVERTSSWIDHLITKGEGNHE
ncbi:hypothetical protein ACFFGV_08130 [Pontibacillus salicampi]|uniref:Zf-HC2 domain-containing protein n=1 Tax=Pontibacillus salicampi TaxID=1449801 RepID=A0ABV6LME7_9BACI